MLLFVTVVYSCHSSIVKDKYHSQYFDGIFSSADSFGMAGKEKAFALLDSAYNAFPNPSPIDLYRKYDYKGTYYYDAGNDNYKTMLYADSQLWAFRDEAYQREFIREYGKALFFKGDALGAVKKYKEAFLYYYQGKLAVEKTRDTCLLSGYISRLGTVSFGQARYNEAIRYYKESLSELSYCTEPKDAFPRFAGQQACLDNIALCYSWMRMNDSAAYYYDSALAYIRQNEKRFQFNYGNVQYIETAKAVIYGNKGEALFLKGDTAQAEALYRESIRINNRKGYDKRDAQYTMAKLAHLYMAGRRFKEAGEMLDELRRSLDSLPGRDVELIWRKRQWRYHGSAGHIRDAYSYLQSYVRLQDSLKADNKSGTDVAAELQDIAHKYELDLLRKRDEMKTVYLVIAIIFFLMAFVISLLVWQNWRKSRKNVAELTRLNRRIGIQNEHMQKAMSALEESQRENTRLLKVVAHDLRNPIGATGSIVSILLNKPDLPEDVKQMLGIIRTSSQNCLEMISDLLHVNTSSEEMEKEPVDVGAVLNYGVDLLKFKAEGKRQRILLRAEPVTLLANREKLWRVISNLITNAIKFSPENTDIVVEMISGDMVRISVKDQGIGIPENMKEKIFDMFTETKRRGTAGEESFGLGLSISRQIVEAHNGKIWCESAEGKGTTFHVELPR